MAIDRRDSIAMPVIAIVLLLFVRSSSGDHDTNDSGVWTVLSEQTPKPISDMTVTTVKDKMFMFGGCDGSQVYVDEFGGFYSCTSVSKTGSVFNIESRTWTATAEMPRQRYRHMAALVGETHIVLLGGRTQEDVLIEEIDSYNTETNEWTTLGIMSPALSDGAGFSDGMKVYIAGGYDAGYTAINSMYSMAWPSPALIEEQPMMEARGDCSAVIIEDFAYVLGGWTHVNSFESPLNTVEAYSMETKKWEQRASLADGRGDKVAVALNGQVHVVGGETKEESAGVSSSVEQVEVYNPDSNTWRALAAISAPRFRFAGAAYKNSVYVFGGQGKIVGVKNTVSSYYPLVSHIERYDEPSHSSSGLSTGAIVGIACGLSALAVICIVALVECKKTQAKPQSEEFANVNNADTVQLESVAGSEDV